MVCLKAVLRAVVWAFPFGSGFPLQVLAMLWAFPCNP